MFMSRVNSTSSPGEGMDEIDKRILRVLEADARTSLRKIAEEVGVALGTVSNRVRRMESLGIIRGYTVLLDPDKAGWGCLLYTSPSPRDED